MKTLLLLLCLLTPLCASDYITCRITYYHASQDKWGAQNACPKTKRSVEGITIAAHPDFKFGDTIEIPKLDGVVGDGVFKVQDRGKWVTSKKASRGKTYVFDVFVSSRKKYLQLKKTMPPYMKVKIK